MATKSLEMLWSQPQQVPRPQPQLLLAEKDKNWARNLPTWGVQPSSPTGPVSHTPLSPALLGCRWNGEQRHLSPPLLGVQGIQNCELRRKRKTPKGQKKHQPAGLIQKRVKLKGWSLSMVELAASALFQANYRTDGKCWGSGRYQEDGQ